MSLDIPRKYRNNNGKGSRGCMPCARCWPECYTCVISFASMRNSLAQVWWAIPEPSARRHTVGRHLKRTGGMKE